MLSLQHKMKQKESSDILTKRLRAIKKTTKTIVSDIEEDANHSFAEINKRPYFSECNGMSHNNSGIQINLYQSDGKAKLWSKKGSAHGSKSYQAYVEVLSWLGLLIERDQ